MEPDHVQLVTGCLARLQDSIIECEHGTSSTVDQALADLTASLHKLLEAHAKGAQEQQLRCDLASKDAECARLQSEIARLRRSIQRLEGMQAPQASASGQQHDVGQVALDSTDRQAVLSAAAMARDGPHANLYALESEVQVHMERISKLESELQAQARESSMRLSQLQDSFVAKTSEMRQNHQQALQRATAAAQDSALAAAHEQSQQQVKQQQEEWQRLEQQLRQELQRVRAQQEADQRMAIELQQQLKDAQQPQQQSKLQKQQQQMAAAAPCSTSSNAAGSLTQQPPVASGPPAPTAAANADAALVALMEGQLMRLSGIIRSHETEIATLRQAVQAGCEERRQLQQQHEALMRQAQSAGAGAAAGGGSVGKGGKMTGGQAVAGQVKAAASAGQLSSPVSRTAVRQGAGK